MVNTIIIKNDDTASNTPADNELVTGELAINTADGKLFYGDASGDAQEFTASISGDTFATDLKIGRDSTDHIFFNNNDRIGVRVANENQIEFKDGQILPVTDDNIDLGSSSYEFKDLYIDGIAYIDQARIGTLGDSINISNNTMTNVDINSGSIDGTPVGANTASTGAFTAVTVDDITIDGSTITDGGTLDFNIGGDLTFDVDGSDIHFKDDGNERFHFKLDSTPTLEVTGDFDIDCSGDITLDAAGDDIIFADAGDTRFTFNLDSSPEIDVAGDFVLDATGQVDIESGGTSDIVLDSAGDIILDYADGDSVIFKHNSTNNMLDISGTGSGNDVTFQLLQDGGDLIFKQYDGTEVARVEDGGLFDVVSNKLAINGTAITATAAELNIMDGVTATATELNKMDGVTATTAELNLLDGGTSVGSSITVGDSDGFIMNDGGTMKSVPASAVKTYAGGGGASTGNFSFSGNTMSNSNDILIDGNGDITLDANGADIFFHDNTTKFATIRNESGGLDLHGGDQTGVKAIVTDSAGKYTTASNWIFTVTAGITNVGTSSLEKLVSFNTTNGNTVDNGGGGDPGDHFYNQTFLVPVDCDLIHVYGSFNEAISNQINMTEFTLSVCDNGSVDFADKYKITEQADETGNTSFGNLGMVAPGVMMDFLAAAGHRIDTGSAGAQSFTAGQKISGGLKVNSNVASGGTRGNWTFVFRTTGGLP